MLASWALPIHSTHMTTTMGVSHTWHSVMMTGKCTSMALSHEDADSKCTRMALSHDDR